MYSYILGLVKSNAMKYLGTGGAVLVVLIYWYILQTRLENALEAKQYAEDNVVLVTTEFDRLYDRYGELTSVYDKEVASNAQTVNRLNVLHAKELERVIATTTIKTKIKDVKDEDDGNVSNILSTTLDALRLYN